MSRLIRYSLPKNGAWKVTAPAASNDQTIYQTIEWFTAAYKANQIQPISDQMEDIALKGIVNLHNVEGVSNLQTIKELTGKIKRQIDITDLETGAPNVHLAKVEADWVVINGHHTIMAYMICGRTKISELPYLIIEDASTGQISPAEILAVYGQYATEVPTEGWQKTVLDWAAPADQRLTERREHNMGELTAAFIKKYQGQLDL